MDEHHKNKWEKKYTLMPPNTVIFVRLVRQKDAIEALWVVDDEMKIKPKYGFYLQKVHIGWQER